MGSLQAQALKELTDEGTCSINDALAIHLGSNHYPPLPASLIQPCKDAIQQANAGNLDALVKLPDGCTWKGKDSAPVRDCVLAWHLNAFLEEG